MFKQFDNLLSLTLLVLLCCCITACGGSGGSNDATIEGTLGTDAVRTGLAEGSAPVSGVTVSALGDSDVTDENGSFVLKADGDVFAGGPVVFTLSGNGIDSELVLADVAGGPGAKAYVDLAVDARGFISGISSDSAGNVLSSIAGFGCTETQSFIDGYEGNLWKPVSESTGTVVILMPAEFQHAALELLNANGDSIARVIKSGCCSHNGGRDHRFLDRTSSSLLGEPLPLTVRYAFPGDRVVCLDVSTPTSRLD